MKSKQETFASLMGSFTHHYDLRSVFDDFLTLSMCAVTQIPGAGKSKYEDLYLETMAKYANSELRHQFSKLFAQLIAEMEERVSDFRGNDVLGEYYEQQFCSKSNGQFFTPTSVCKFMAKCLLSENEPNEQSFRVLDPTCGSGRMLLATSHCFGRNHLCYGIDIDHTCVKMTALNLFLNGVFNSEVMWGNALNPDDFRISYAISFLPLGIFRIEQKEQSKLWHLHKNSFEKKQPAIAPNLKLPSESGEIHTAGASQLQLF